jgi:hypothetical protein
MKKMLGLLAAALLLNACGSGGSGSTSDVQQGSGSITVNTSTFNINSFTATGCQTIPANGSCTLQINGYTGTGIFTGQLTGTNPNGYTSNISQCNSAAALIANSCYVTISNTNGNVSTGQIFGVIANGQSAYPLVNITVGGGI